MGHCVVEEAEKILDEKFSVLDKGFVRLVDYMGSDERVVQSARVSYGSGTKSFREDKGLINYLLRNEHTSPFEQVVFTFHTKMPIFVARQWVRHRMARVNEISGRYSVMKKEFYIPASEDVALQSTNNKQGRSTEAIPEELVEKVRDQIREEQERSYQGYSLLLDENVARELARVNLPLSLYTEWYWQIDLHNLFHFLKLRMDAHAQKEIRVYAEVIRDIAAKVCPIAMEAFENHIHGGVRFSSKELDALEAVLSGGENPLKGKALERFEMKIKERHQL